MKIRLKWIRINQKSLYIHIAQQNFLCSLQRLPVQTSCKDGGFDLIYLDILAAKALPKSVYRAYK